MRIHSKLKSGELLSSSQLVGLLIILVTTALVFIIIGKLSVITDSTASANCAAAVQNAGLVNKVYGREAAVNITGCNTQHITINMTDLSSAARKNPAVAENETKHRLAEAMRQCWQNWGSGRLDLFNSAGDYCSVCSVITFTKELQGNVSNLSNFSGYLDNTTFLPGMTYKQLLQGYASVNTDISGGNLASPPYKVSTAEPIAVIFWYSKEKGASSIIEKVFNIDVPPSRVAGIASTLTSALLLSTGVGVLMNGQVSTLTGGLAYAYARMSEDWNVMSATYIIPYDPDNQYVKQCNQAANTITSP